MTWSIAYYELSPRPLRIRHVFYQLNLFSSHLKLLFRVQYKEKHHQIYWRAYMCEIKHQKVIILHLYRCPSRLRSVFIPDVTNHVTTTSAWLCHLILFTLVACTTILRGFEIRYIKSNEPYGILSIQGVCRHNDGRNRCRDSRGMLVNTPQTSLSMFLLQFERNGEIITYTQARRIFGLGYIIDKG
jgi:hypothetical protein